MPELEKELQNQLRSEPVVLLHRIPEPNLSSVSIGALSHNNSSGDEDLGDVSMQRYQIVKKATDSRDPNATSSLNLKINLAGFYLSL